MSFCDIQLPSYTYSNHLASISGIKLTHREIDIIAFILNGRSAKKIASFLDISPKTVETHTRNIMQKVGVNSREGLIDFIENSGKLWLFKKYYLSLLVHAIYERALSGIRLLDHLRKATCLIILDSEGLAESPFTKLLKKSLQSVNIKTRSYRLTSTEPFLSKLPPSSYTIYLIEAPLENHPPDSDQKKLIDFLINKTASTHSLFVFGSEHPSNFLQNINPRTFIALKEYPHPYFVILEIFKKLLSQPSLQKTIDAFKDQYELITGDTPKDDFLDKPKEKESQGNLGSLRKWKRFLKDCKLIILTCCVLGLILLSYPIFLLKNKASISKISNSPSFFARSELTLPAQNTLLPRSTLIGNIQEKLKSSQSIRTVALTGVGGSGKTTLARHYLSLQNADISWEINAETKESLLSSFEGLAYALSKTNLEIKNLREILAIKNPSEKESKLIQFVKDHLKLHPHWLLLYDNVDKFADIQNYFPLDPKAWGIGNVILTTRNSNIKDNDCINHIIPLGTLSSQEKFTLFKGVLSQSFSKEKSKHIEIFLEQIPPFPLDVSVAAYYLKNTNVPYSKYLEYLKKHNQDFLNIQKEVLDDATKYAQTRYGIIALALRKLIETHEAFEGLMLLISLIDPQNIPRDLLASYKNDLVVDNFIYNLKKYSLITEQPLSTHQDSPSFSIHRSTQEISLAFLLKHIKLKKDKELLTSITNAFERHIADITEEENLIKMKPIVSHCEKLISHMDLLPLSSKASIEGDLGFIYYYLGDYLTAKIVLEKALSLLRKQPEKNAEKIAKVLFYIGNVYWDLGEFNHAKNVVEESLNIYRKKAPENKLGLTHSLSLLGILYSELNEYKKAKSTLEETLMIYERHLPHYYKGIATALVYSGMVDRYLGNFKKAKVMLEKSISIYDTYLPESYAATAYALANLGNVYKDLGEYEKARLSFEKGIELYKKHLPTHQVEIARWLARIASLNKELGYYTKAESLLEECLKIYRKHLPENHVGMAWGFAHLGTVHNALKNNEKAKDLLEKSLLIYKKNLPDNCVEVARARAFLGNIHKDLGNFKKAYELLEGSLIVYERNYGKTHPEYARILRYLGETYLMQGRAEESESLLLKSLSIFKREDHPETSLLLEDLADLYLLRSTKASEKKDKLKSEELKKKAADYLSQALEIIKTKFLKVPTHYDRAYNKLKNLKSYESL